MNRIKFGLLGIGIVALTLNAQAAQESHGGQGVVCPDSSGNIKTIEMDDYYEGSIYLSSAGTLDLGDTNASYQDQITAMA